MSIMPTYRSPVLTLSDITRRLSQPVSTTHRQLRELTRWGALERDEAGRYSIGLHLWEVGALAPRSKGLREVSLPFLEDLYEATHQNVQVAVLDGDEVVYVERLFSHHATRIMADRQVELVSTSVAAPIRGPRNTVVAALSVIIPSRDNTARSFMPAVVTAARGISRSLGRRSPAGRRPTRSSPIPALLDCRLLSWRFVCRTGAHGRVCHACSAPLMSTLIAGSPRPASTVAKGRAPDSRNSRALPGWLAGEVCSREAGSQPRLRRAGLRRLRGGHARGAAGSLWVTRSG
jgi:DNA-binding IclR family transcriptional regulator